MNKVALIVLAAGSSTRMGTPKQLLKIGNSTLLETVLVAAVDSLAEKVFCVLGAARNQIEQSIAHLDVEVILNPEFSQGLSSSVLAGLRVVNDGGFDSALLVLGDQPAINSVYLDLLIQTQASSVSKIVASSYQGRAGVPAIIPHMYFSELMTIEGDRGATDFLNGSLPVCTIDGGILIDLDTCQDYQRYLKD